jgi:hypothetical protein
MAKRFSAPDFDINRLKTALNNSKIATENNALYQTIDQLISKLGELNTLNNSKTNAIDKEIQKIVDFVNKAIVREVLTSDPVNPAPNTWWIVREGVTPTLNISLKAFIDGSIVVIAVVTI